MIELYDGFKSVDEQYSSSPFNTINLQFSNQSSERNDFLVELFKYLNFYLNTEVKNNKAESEYFAQLDEWLFEENIKLNNNEKVELRTSLLYLCASRIFLEKLRFFVLSHKGLLTSEFNRTTENLNNLYKTKKMIQGHNAIREIDNKVDELNFQFNKLVLKQSFEKIIIRENGPLTVFFIIAKQIFRFVNDKHEIKIELIGFLFAKIFILLSNEYENDAYKLANNVITGIKRINPTNQKTVKKVIPQFFIDF